MNKKQLKHLPDQEVHYHVLMKIIEKYYINQKRSDGIFMESGAFNGINKSLSLFLEKKYGFNGVLVEPILREYIKLRNNRPKCFNLNLCLSNENEKKEFIEMGMRSAFKDTEFTNSALKYMDRRAKSGKVTKITKIHTKKASTIMNDLNLNYLDVWILDVEGHELQALQGYNFKHHPVYLIVLEVQRRRQFPEEYRKIEKLLKEKGFSLKLHPDFPDAHTSEDEFWVNENYFRKDLLYKKNLFTKIKDFFTKND